MSDAVDVNYKGTWKFLESHTIMSGYERNGETWNETANTGKLQTFHENHNLQNFSCGVTASETTSDD